jgi:hypothetical protein
MWCSAQAFGPNHQTGVLMSIFTRRELEFLASLKKSWDRLYRSELVRLLKEDDNQGEARAPSGRSTVFAQNPATPTPT